jgi:tetratricopeptide (TPR) repeat protein
MDKDKRVNLVFLDACRDNPLPKTIDTALETRNAKTGQGLAQIKGAIDTLIVFATEPDNVALDGEGRNSPFTTALLKHIRTPNIEISSLMKRVRSDVVEVTRQKQVPWDHSSLRSDVVLASTGAAPSTSSLVASLSQGSAPVYNEREALVAECDRAAADPYDVNKPDNVRGVHRNVIAREALQICAKAIVNEEMNPRMNYQLGRALYAANDYAKARVFFQQAANIGYPQAVTELGRMSFFGHGTKQSYDEARKQFEKAAALRDPSAIKNLGFMYHTGRGVKADVRKAISYYEKAPDHPTVMNNMAMLYRQGQGVPKDQAKAVRMFEQAILGGDESAMANLADMYETGEGVPKDLDKAKTLYRMSAALGDQIARQALARLK